MRKQENKIQVLTHTTINQRQNPRISVPGHFESKHMAKGLLAKHLSGKNTKTKYQPK